MEFQSDDFSHLLAGIPLFDDLNFDEIAIVRERLFPHDFAPGSSIFKEGTHGNACCFVAKGEIEISKTSEDGKKAVIATLGPGQTVGEMAVIDGLIRSATATAKKASTVVVMRRADFEQICRDHPEIGIKITKGIARHLSLNLRDTSKEFTKVMLSLA